MPQRGPLKTPKDHVWNTSRGADQKIPKGNVEKTEKVKN